MDILISLALKIINIEDDFICKKKAFKKEKRYAKKGKKVVQKQYANNTIILRSIINYY
jgi:hypothetical protein